MKFHIPPQTEAEQDKYLFECFHDANFISALLENNYTVITGRKGTGKTALAKFLHSKHEDYGIDFAYRISIDEFSGKFNGKFKENSADVTEIILFYILTRTIQLLVTNNRLSKEHSGFWQDFLIQNGLQDINEYQAFVEWASEHESGVDLKLLSGKNKKEHKRIPIASGTGNLFEYLSKSIAPGEKLLLFIDDLTDYLDQTDEEQISKEICVVRDILLRLDKYNSILNEKGKNLSFICCIRDDLWSHMEGSNINKLKHNSLKIKWTEKSFCSLLIRRLPFYQKELDEALKSPEEYILKQFPNKIFATKLKGTCLKRYKTNFYAYMMAISFNRPRDFLKFCYAMRARLSSAHLVEVKNIESAEIEYSDYFIGEIKDELFLTSKILGFKDDLEGIQKLVYVLGQKDSFGYVELKTEVSKYLGKGASHNTTALLIKELWWYGVLGFNRERGELDFNYVGNKINFPIENELKSYGFHLHKGLLWSLKKR